MARGGKVGVCREIIKNLHTTKKMETLKTENRKKKQQQQQL